MAWAGPRRPKAANVRVGRVIVIDLPGSDAAGARAKAEAMCGKLLANPVIESWRVEVAP
jgi:phosphoribosylformylglycinamidine synthase